MGNIYTGSCPCGYESDQLLTGYGMMGDKYRLCQCSVCHSFSTPNGNTKEPRCSHCRSRRLTVIDTEQDDILLLCPECGKQTLKLNMCGCWE